MLIGYDLVGQDNGSDMMPDSSLFEKCSKCGYITDFDFINPNIVLKKKKYDFSHPYDIGIIVSENFKKFCENNLYKGLYFIKLKKYDNFYFFKTENRVKYDIINAPNIRFKNKCDVCGKYEYLLSPYPIILESVFAPLVDGFYATDLYFGSNNSKNPITIVAPETYRKLKAAKLKGLDFREIHARITH